MASIISASTTSGTALNMSADTTGILQLATGATPTTALTIDASQRVAFVAGTAALPAITTTGDTNTGMFFPAADTIAFAEGGAEVMRIDSSGNVLVNTTGTWVTAKSAVVGAGTASTFAFAAYQGGGNAGAAGTFRVDGTGTDLATWYYQGGVVGRVTTNSANTTYGTSSDYRLKENITPMIGALDTVAQLKPVTYKWKQDGSDGQGFIAHELQEIVPDAVQGEKDAVDAEGKPVYQGVDTSFLVATLTAAIQEQTQIINDLKARVTALEGA